MKMTLKKPLKTVDKELTEIQFDFEKLTGSDIISVENELRMKGIIIQNITLSQEGIATLAARASGLTAEDIIGLSAPDFLHVHTKVSDFLYDWGLMRTDQ